VPIVQLNGISIADAAECLLSILLPILPAICCLFYPVMPTLLLYLILLPILSFLFSFSILFCCLIFLFSFFILFCCLSCHANSPSLSYSPENLVILILFLYLISPANPVILSIFLYLILLPILSCQLSFSILFS
jgi:hypothetical protein